MDGQLLVICGLTFVIHLIGTLAYAVRIAGVRTRKIALSLSLFNILVLVSRLSNTFQGPLLAKRIERNILDEVFVGRFADFQWILASASAATIAGAVLIPTFQRLFSQAVLQFQSHRSVPRLIGQALFKGSLGPPREWLRLPAPANWTQLRWAGVLSPWVLVLNVAGVALWTNGVFAAMYAGYLNPELRLTSSALSAVINGIATILMFVFVDPLLSALTDDVVEGRVSEPRFRQAVVWLVISRLLGTLLAQAILVPAAGLIAYVARVM